MYARESAALVLEVYLVLQKFSSWDEIDKL